MNEWTFVVMSIVFYGSQGVLGQLRILDITGNNEETANPVWFSDQVQIIARRMLAIEWLFNSQTIATFDSDTGEYTYPNTINAVANTLSTDSILDLYNVTSINSGTYNVVGSSSRHQLNVTIHSNES